MEEIKGKGIEIAGLKLENRFVLAPMAAINCTSYRMLCKKHGAALIYTQMIDADLMASKSKEEVLEFLNIKDEERPVVVQLIGNDKGNLLKTIGLVEDVSDIIDLNLGCIVPKYLEKECGAYILQDIDSIKEIVSSMVERSSKPISAKIRIGWDNQSINAVKVAKVLEECGVSMIAVHGRTAEQKYGGKSNWTAIKQVKQAVGIPVVANGDVSTYEEGLQLLEKTGADLVMIGREAKHSPWIFDKDFVKNNENIVDEILEFIALYERHENRFHTNEIKEHVFWMMRDIKTKKDKKELQKELKLIEKVEEIKELLNNLK